METRIDHTRRKDANTGDHNKRGAVSNFNISIDTDRMESAGQTLSAE